MVVPELKAWRAARPRLARVARTARPHVVRAARTVRPRLARWTRAVRPRPAGRGAWRYTAGAVSAGLALAAGVAAVAGPWDSSGQRTAERDRAAAQGPAGGADHGDGSDSSGAGDPQTAISAAPVLVGLGRSANTVRSASGGPALADVLGPLLADPALGARHGAAVVDIATGRRLFGEGTDDALTPASTTKIATATAALSALGADHRLTTRAALEPGTGELVLVGGGDPTLTARKDARGWASLRTLAANTAAALKKRGTSRVTLSYDTTLYAGTGLHPIGVNDNLAAVSALTADEARTDGSTSGPAPRAADPAADAARSFGRFLNAQGITTTAPGPSKATARATTLAAVSSPPLSALVERMLTNSDNDIAEALARQTAAATGRRPDFQGGAAAIADRLARLHLPLAGAAFHDGSGLDRSDRLTADLLTALLTKAGDPAHPELRPVLTGLPVAHFTGTLSGRYKGGAAGVVRAKTGTLTGVNTLAGTVVDRDGRLLAFAFLAQDTTGPDTAQAALDRTATALAGCGCR
ncbi:D-alanyl-D-alanine carboxypeptidase/D-alanyl-D-alanine endopeptidase [Streptomyces tropicalis]|uniref:D-alanyl-D-alanine carboxypeptidase/D-alanyl-D-alanine-endopeptidase n=1 Tax=Streptomyces tropicalis TaxID=3034234 RepID=A0ABT6A7J8_9ACTN|nr:D-alanyl-D-alanine carboxypeptidase/D-alanyl-D-alanine-endopeptidase [Streptomyces tropicalis]MDF3300625.1 D-alanyl-D-alanine carboxypeptidase/D-alanyl-D-alanine-endopeptidase [Streptomyces tropicalis]